MTTTEAPVTAPGANPFVGPRSLTREEHLHGRDREVRELRNLIVADRIVLCYSPSGAGKTSIIQAGLIPHLEEDGFAVLPVVRVNRPPEGEGNRYVASALACLGAPAGTTDLAAGLAALPADEGRTRVLVFDQFEEVLSLDPTDGEAKRAFFTQLGAVLRDRRWFALFAMREDFLAALDPYLHHLPTRLSTRFRLDLLTPAAAQEVVAGTTAAAGRTCAEPVRASLVTELSRLVDGRVGPYVEPVQLQVVCRQLWERLPEGATEITADDLGAVGDVDGALAAFYAEEVAAVATATGAPERAIRDWFERVLITDRGYRGQAQSGPTADEQVVRALVDAHLVRAETRRGTTWYELAHDRLVQPVRADNRAWRERHLTAFQRQAELWDEHSRADDMVVVDDVLDEGERLADAPGTALTPVESAFLAACRRTRDEKRKEREAARRTRRLAVFSTVGLAVAVLASVLAGVQLSAARTQRNRAEANERLRLATPADDEVDADPNASAILALQAVSGEDEVTDRAGLTAQRALYSRVFRTSRVGVTIPRFGARRAAYGTGGRIALAGGFGASLLDPAALDEAQDFDEIPAVDVAFSPKGDAVAVGIAGRNPGARVFRLVDGVLDDGSDPVELPATDKRAVIDAVAFDPSGDRLAIGAGSVAQVWRWRAEDQTAAVDTLSGHGAAVRGVAFNHDGTLLATASGDGTVKLWGVPAAGGATDTYTLRGHVGAVNDVAFNPDGTLLATAGEDGTVRLWDVATGRQVRELSGHQGSVNRVAFRADGRRLAAAGDDGTAQVWDPVAGRVTATAGGGTGAVTGVAFSPDGRRLLLTTSGGAPAEWDVSAEAPTGHTGDVRAVAFSPEGDRVVTASADGTAAVWDAKGQEVMRLTGHEDEVRAVAFAFGGRVATGGSDGTARVWDADTGLPVRAYSGQASVEDVALSRNGARLAATDGDGTVRVWSVDSGALLWAKEPPAAGAGFRGVAFTENGAVVVTGRSDGSAALWNTETGAPVQELPAARGDDGVEGVAVSPDGSQVAAATDAGEVVWDLATGKVQAAFGDPGAEPHQVAFSDDGSLLLGGDGALRRVTDGSVVARVDAGPGVAFSPNGRTLATGGPGAQARLWMVESGQPTATLGTLAPGHRDAVKTLAADRQGRLLATGGDDGLVVVWDARTGRPLHHIDAGGSVGDVRFSPDGTRLVTAGDSGPARVWDSRSGRLVGTFPPPKEGEAPGFVTAAFGPDGTTVVTVAEGDEGGRAEAVVWDLAGRRAPARRPLPEGDVLALSDDGRSVAVQRDGVEVLDTRSGDRRAAFPKVAGVYSAVFDAAGGRLLVDADSGEEGGSDHVLLLDTGSGRATAMPSPPPFLDSLALSADGRRAAATTWGQAVVWDTDRRRVAFDVPLEPDASVVAFGAGNRFLAASPVSAPGRPRAYPLDLPILRKAAEAGVARALTDDECQRYLQREAPCAFRPR